MNKKIFNKKFIYFFLISLSLMSTIFVITKIYKNSLVSHKTPTSPPSNNQAAYQKIVPGVSSKNDVISLLGEPLTEEENTIEYKSSSPNFNHQITLDQEKVSFIKEIITLKEKKSSKDITNVYGVPKKMLFGPDAAAGFYLFVYPENGIAYVGHPESGLLLEIWYFPPTNMEDFISKYTQGYSETRQIIQ